MQNPPKRAKLERQASQMELNEQVIFRACEDQANDLCTDGKTRLLRQLADHWNINITVNAQPSSKRKGRKDGGNSITEKKSTRLHVRQTLADRIGERKSKKWEEEFVELVTELSQTKGMDREAYIKKKPYLESVEACHQHFLEDKSHEKAIQQGDFTCVVYHVTTEDFFVILTRVYS